MRGAKGKKEFCSFISRQKNNLENAGLLLNGAGDWALKDIKRLGYSMLVLLQSLLIESAFKNPTSLSPEGAYGVTRTFPW